MANPFFAFNKKQTEKVFDVINFKTKIYHSEYFILVKPCSKDIQNGFKGLKLKRC